MTTYQDLSPLAIMSNRFAPGSRKPLTPAIEAAYGHLIAEGDTANAAILSAAIHAEWPVISEDDPARLAYSRAPQQGDRRTKTSVGKWLQRHLPNVFGGRAMDQLLAIHIGGCKRTSLVYLKTSAEITDHMRTARHEDMSCGFGSCMTAQNLPDPHPYAVYDPSLGWSIALLKDDGKVVARALINDKSFVRIYADDSQKTEQMRFALTDDGCSHADNWTGKEIKAIKSNGKWLGPYIDPFGSKTCGELCGDVFVLTTNNRADYEFNKINGYAEIYEEDHEGECELNNGDWVPEDEAVQLEDGDWVREEDAVYLEYRRARGSRISGYYLVEECVELENGNWALSEDAVSVAGGYYLQGDDAIVYDNSLGRYILAEDSVCLANGDYAHYDDAVGTRDGEWELRRDCQKLEDETFVLKEDAIEIGGQWYSREDCDQNEEGEWGVPKVYPALEDANEYAIEMPEVANANA